ncbi:MAG TPA: sigma-70 family RNA polymerase sigma factor [Rectinemataceae bacterium]|nr:sigma-70 family RNA polymerase sigma factor [Rectinemataceae bacterium]
MSAVVASDTGGPSDEEAISRVLEGDTEAYAILVRRHHARVLRIGFSFFKGSEDAEDFAQEVFIKAYAALGSFQGKSRFSTWLLRIAYNAAINEKRRRRESLPLDDELLVGSAGSDYDHLREEAARAVREAMAELPQRQALCLELFFYYDMKYAEISEITGFPVNTIKSHVFRAKRLLRQRLGEGSEVDGAM